jgi:quinol monooxygenase YgiN
MLSEIEAISKDVLDGIAGLFRTRFVRTADDHLMVMSTYESMEELEAANTAHASIFSDFAKYIVGEPIIRSGEVIEAVDGPAPGIGYMRFTRAVFDPSNYDTMMSSLDGQLEKLFKEIPGLSRLRVVRIAEAPDRMIAAAAYTDKSAADAARDTAQAALSGMAEYLTEPPFVREGDLVWSYVR